MLAVHDVEALLDDHDAVIRFSFGVFVDIVLDALLCLADERFEFLELVFLALEALIEVSDNLAIV